MLLTIIPVLIVISFSLPTLSFIPDLKPSFSANPSPTLLQHLLTTWIPQTFRGLFRLFSFSVLHFLVVVSVR